MDTKTQPAPPRPAAEDDLQSGNIDKVRDILFGGQMREYERRFSRLEERLAQDTAEMKDEVRRRLAALESFVRQESESLAARLTSEHEERTDVTRDLAQDVRAQAKAFEKKAGQLDDQIGRVQRDLRQQLLDVQKSLDDELRRKVEDVLGRLARESRELRADKADRATIAALLTEMAMRLTNDLSLPGLDAGDDRNG